MSCSGKEEMEKLLSEAKPHKLNVAPYLLAFKRDKYFCDIVRSHIDHVVYFI